MGPLATSSSIQPALAKPLLRGVLHQIGFSASLVLGTLLIVGAGGPSEHVAASVFAGSVALCFGLSALYHRVNWRPRARLWMRRADHAGIYLLIAGTYTPVCLLALDGAWRFAVLAVVWLAAAAAIILKFAWVGAPKWLAAVIGIALGWAGVALMPQLATRVHPAAIVLLALGRHRVHGRSGHLRTRDGRIPRPPSSATTSSSTRSRSSASRASTSRSRSS